MTVSAIIHDDEKRQETFSEGRDSCLFYLVV